MRLTEVFGRRLVRVLAAVALLLAACGSDVAAVSENGADVGEVAVGESEAGAAAEEDDLENEEPAAAEPDDRADASAVDDPVDDADNPTEPVGDDASGDAADEVMEPPSELVLDTADWDGLVEWNLAALGGLSFGVPEGLVVHHDADMVTIRSKFAIDSGRYDPSMVVALADRTGSGFPVDANGFTSHAIAGFGSAEPTNSTLTLFGEQLEGWRFTVNERQNLGPHYLYSAYAAGVDGQSAWQPFPHAELYLADVPGGVLAVGWTGQDDVALAEARAIFDVVAPTLTLARPFSETAGPLPALALEATQPPPDPVEIPAGWPDELTALSTPLDAGDYSLAGLGTALSFTLDEGWWVQPNFPSWVILTGADSFGPGDRSIQFRTGVDQFLPAIRAGAGGAGVPFDARAMIEIPPDNIEVLENETVDLGGAQGVRVRLAFDATADCATEICEYMVTTKYPFPPTSLRSGYQYEIWHFDEGIAEPITLIVEAPDPLWFAHARAVIDSMVFDAAS